MLGTMKCIYETPCHWCSKWDKKCDLEIGCKTPNDQPNQKDSTSENIKSGIELTPLNITNHNVRIRKEPKSCKILEELTKEN